MKKLFTALLFSVFYLMTANAQTADDSTKIAGVTNTQKTANTKDIITPLFRAAIDNLLGKNHSYTFNSSFYGIDSLLRRSGSKVNYSQRRWEREISLNIGLTGDTLNNVTKIAGGFTFNILNNKDINYKRIDQKDVLMLDSMISVISAIKKTYNELIYKKSKNELVLRKDTSINEIKIIVRDTVKKPNFKNGPLLKSIDSSWNAASNSHDFSKLHPLIMEALNNAEFINMVYELVQKREGNFPLKYVQSVFADIIAGKDPFQNLFKAIATRYAQKALWTFTPTAYYNRVTQKGESSFSSVFTVGLSRNHPNVKPWEIEAKALLKLNSDTVVNKTGYDNKPFTVSLGVNKVLLQNEAKESRMEFKVFTEYDRNFGTLAPKVDTQVFSFNSTLRVNVYKSLWLPVTLKYDPKNASFFGYFSITANLGN